MRLLNVLTLELKEYYDAIPRYAILSHTWNKEEVTFDDIQTPHDARIQSKHGFQKIKFLCAQALVDGISHAWIDTCCINKSSSSELTEAINSMFEYYQGADVCYAYLEDVHGNIDQNKSKEGFRRSRLPPGAGRGPDGEIQEELKLEFKRSRWFTRAWTLQELIAPPRVEFYTSTWTQIGNKQALSDLIVACTKLPRAVLFRPQAYRYYSIACKMSWAANRMATRQEDIAYSLMGMFSVNMPLLYGEGKKAFRRLQEALVRSDDDQTLLAWMADDYARGPVGLFASSPKDFEACGSFIPARSGHWAQTYQLTNLGLLINLPLLTGPTDAKGTRSISYAFLNCHGRNGNGLLGIPVVLSRNDHATEGPKYYIRYHLSTEDTPIRNVSMSVIATLTRENILIGHIDETAPLCIEFRLDEVLQDYNIEPLLWPGIEWLPDQRLMTIFHYPSNSDYIPVCFVFRAKSQSYSFSWMLYMFYDILDEKVTVQLEADPATVRDPDNRGRSAFKWLDAHFRENDRYKNLHESGEAGLARMTVEHPWTGISEVTAELVEEVPYNSRQYRLQLSQISVTRL